MSIAMMLRLGVAVLGALVGAGWLLARKKSPQGAEQQFTTLRIGLLVWSGIWAVVWLVIAAIRLPYPYEMEWCGGSMKDHCEQLVAGRPLYVPPGSGWFPYEYPPLYFWLGASLMKWMGVSYVPLRLISIGSTVICAVVLFLWLRHLLRQNPGVSERRTTMFWAAISVGIWIASYRFTGAWFDVERIDMLFLAFALLGGYLLTLACERNDKIAILLCCLSVVYFWLGFLTKQQGILHLVGGGLALLVARKWKLLLVYVPLGISLCFGSIRFLDWQTDGLFSYFCFHIPLANGVRLHLALSFLVNDLPLFAPCAALLAVAVFKSLRRWKTELPRVSAAEWQFWSFFGVAMLGTLLSRAHWGGDQNTLMAGFMALGCGACLIAARLESNPLVHRLPLYGLVLVQFLVLVYKPQEQIPTAAHRNAGDLALKTIRELEKEGEVFWLDHGNMTTPRHFHIMAMHDVLATEKRLPASFREAVQNKRFAAILTDAKPTMTGDWSLLLDYYYIEDTLHFEQPWVVTGFPTPNPERTVWLLKRK